MKRFVKSKKLILTCIFAVAALITFKVWQMTRTIIRFERTICFGTCPAYEFTVFGDGTVFYIGKSFVNVTGPRLTHLTAAQLSKLKQAIKQYDFFSMADQRAAFGVDAPFTYISVTMDGESKTFSHFHGLHDASDAAYALEFEIRRIVGLSKWVSNSVDYANVEEYLKDVREIRVREKEIRERLKKDIELRREQMANLKLTLTPSGVATPTLIPKP